MALNIILQEKKEKSLLRHHPWIFSKAVARVDNDVKSGSIVKVLDSNKKYLCTGVYSAKSQIRVRVLSFNEQETIDYNFVKNRILNAKALRANIINKGNDGYRLIASEGDFLPGLIVDVFNDILVISISSYAMEILYDYIVKALHELYPDYKIYERSDTASRLKEGLKERKGAVIGTVEEEAQFVLENNTVYIPIDIVNGHKTGGYLDQRHSRYHLMSLCKNKTVLNCFSYTGGFGLYALKGGASKVINVDVSKHALLLAKQGVAFNHLDPGHCKFIAKDVFTYLRDEVEKGSKYDVIILDPPKFIKGQQDLQKGCRGYQDINRLALMLLAPGGRLLTFSCSGLMDLNLFQKIVADAALDAKVDARLMNVLRQDEDHCVALPCPESFYLKGLDIAII